MYKAFIRYNEALMNVYVCQSAGVETLFCGCQYLHENWGYNYGAHLQFLKRRHLEMVFISLVLEVVFYGLDERPRLTNVACFIYQTSVLPSEILCSLKVFNKMLIRSF